MDRRRERRFPTGRAVRVTVLSADPVCLAGRIANTSGRGMRLLVDRPIPCNSPVRVDWDDSILLGEVCYAAETDGRYAVGLLLDQDLKQLDELTQLAEAILESRPVPTVVPPAGE